MRETYSPLRILISFTLNICWGTLQLARGLFAACLSEPRLILYWKYRIYRESCSKDSVYLSSRDGVLLCIEAILLYQVRCGCKTTKWH